MALYSQVLYVVNVGLHCYKAAVHFVLEKKRVTWAAIDVSTLVLKLIFKIKIILSMFLYTSEFHG